MARRRLGFLGPAIVLVGAAVAGLALWYMLRVRPKVGEVLDTFEPDPTSKIVIRGEAGGDRAFVELHSNGTLAWQAMVPPYAGRRGQRGIAWSDTAVTVRVVRGEKAEVFALSRTNGSKLGGIHLAPKHDKIKRDATSPLNIFDDVRSHELVVGDGWNHLTTVDLRLGVAIWARELGAPPIENLGLEGGVLSIEQRIDQQLVKRYFNALTGKEDVSVETTGRRAEEALRIEIATTPKPL